MTLNWAIDTDPKQFRKTASLQPLNHYLEQVSERMPASQAPFSLLQQMPASASFAEQRSKHCKRLLKEHIILHNTLQSIFHSQNKAKHNNNVHQLYQIICLEHTSQAKKYEIIFMLHVLRFRKRMEKNLNQILSYDNI